MEMPYSSRPEASAPSTKYFNAASLARVSSRRSAISAYSDNDKSSKPIYKVRKWLALTITHMPSSANIVSE